MRGESAHDFQGYLRFATTLNIVQQLNLLTIIVTFASTESTNYPTNKMDKSI